MRRWRCDLHFMLESLVEDDVRPSVTEALNRLVEDEGLDFSHALGLDGFRSEFEPRSCGGGSSILMVDCGFWTGAGLGLESIYWQGGCSDDDSSDRPALAGR